MSEEEQYQAYLRRMNNYINKSNLSDSSTSAATPISRLEFREALKKDE